MTELFKRCLYAKYIHTNEDGDYAIEVEGDTLYLLFECSDGKADWRNNFDFLATLHCSISAATKPYKDMADKWKVHRGFLKVWKAMRDEVEGKVAEALEIFPEIARIVCVGYSHGGALCVLATEDMSFLYGDNYEVEGYGFGAPRVLYGKIPQSVKDRLKCFVTIRNIPDLVTFVPPKLFGFKNAGTLLKVGKKFRYTPIKAHYASAYIKELTEYERQKEIKKEEDK